MMTLRRWVLGPVAALALVLGLLGLLSGSEPFAQGQPGCTVTVQPGQSIQQAIDAASEGAVICLAVGTYQENLIIGKSLTLRGLGATPTEVWIVGARDGYPIMRIESESEIEVTIEKLMAAEAKGFLCTVDEQRICANGVQVSGQSKVILRDTQLSNNVLGLVVMGSASVTLNNSTISNNYLAGLTVEDSTRVEVRSSAIEGNGTDESCKEKEWTCNGIIVAGKSQTTITESKIINNADWGVGAILEQCLYGNGFILSALIFTGQVSIDEQTVIEGNNMTGNQDSMGNPGNHPWNRPDVPDGQVCLP